MKPYWDQSVCCWLLKVVVLADQEKGPLFARSGSSHVPEASWKKRSTAKVAPLPTKRPIITMVVDMILGTANNSVSFGFFGRLYGSRLHGSRLHG